MKEMTISVSDLLAVLLRKGKAVVLIGVVFAVLLGALKAVPMWMQRNEPTCSDQEAAAHEQEVRELEDTIETATRNIERQREYMDKSLLMQIDPYDKYVTEIYLSISGVDETATEMMFGIASNPMYYLLERITTQYRVAWSTLDLPSALGLPQYENVEDKYVRELVSVDFPSAGSIVIKAMSSSAEEAKELADAAYSLLQNSKAAVTRNSCEHDLLDFKTVQKSLVDLSLADSQNSHQKRIETYNDTIAAAKFELSAMNEPDGTSVLAVIKMVIIGGVVGVILACLWICCKSLLRGSLQSSSHAERALKVPFIGSANVCKGPLCKFASTVAGEREWKSQQQALDYISEVVKARVAGKQLLLVSTLELDIQGDVEQKLQSALSADGVSVSFAEDFTRNPKAVALLKACDTAVLVERVDHSKISEISEVLSYAEEYTKSVAGIVLI